MVICFSMKMSMCNSLGKERREAVGVEVGRTSVWRRERKRETGRQEDQKLRKSNTVWESQGRLHKGCNSKAESCKTNRILSEKKCR